MKKLGIIVAATSMLAAGAASAHGYGPSSVQTNNNTTGHSIGVNLTTQGNVTNKWGTTIQTNNNFTGSSAGANHTLQSNFGGTIETNSNFTGSSFGVNTTNQFNAN